MLKDSERYPEDTGGWAYFSIGHQQPPYQKLATKHPKERCAQCHIDRVGAEQDYVFSVNQPGLSREGDDARHNLEAAFPN
ncbi:cytochrome P460 family protein [Pararhizobium sp. PWRC1-1]|uniref:cytochrome P460 family protein n=1 Tax=Pararhizobium sp. PWRC1-1 TaxID=2804566 RepID=UPI003CE9EC5F